jgi:hypothetical protein
MRDDAQPSMAVDVQTDQFDRNPDVVAGPLNTGRLCATVKQDRQV